jgi:beta-amylase
VYKSACGLCADLNTRAADIFYRDREGGADEEYLTLGVDYQPVLAGRTALQVYADYMSSLEQTFRIFLQKGTINQIQVGMGPAGNIHPRHRVRCRAPHVLTLCAFVRAGELRYPSYQLSKWSYCGVGEYEFLSLSLSLCHNNCKPTLRVI